MEGWDGFAGAFDGSGPMSMTNNTTSTVIFQDQDAFRQQQWQWGQWGQSLLQQRQAPPPIGIGTTGLTVKDVNEAMVDAVTVPSLPRRLSRIVGDAVSSEVAAVTARLRRRSGHFVSFPVEPGLEDMVDEWP